MKYVNLGRSGLKVSRLCLGCMSYGEPERLPQPWSLDEKASRPLIRQALEAGINFFDTANIYSGGSSEEITGKALTPPASRVYAWLRFPSGREQHPKGRSACPDQPVSPSRRRSCQGWLRPKPDRRRRSENCAGPGKRVRQQKAGHASSCS